MCFSNLFRGIAEHETLEGRYHMPLAGGRALAADCGSLATECARFPPSLYLPS